MPSMHIKNGGAWDQVKRGEAFMKQAGVQEKLDNIFLKNGGVWYPMFPLIAESRWGYAPFAGADLLQSTETSVQEFMDNNLSTLLPSNADGEQFSVALPDSNTYAYFATPAIMGSGVLFLDTVSQFTGGWDGATWSLDPFSDGSFLNYGPTTVQYDGGRGVESWHVYRTDYPGPSSSVPWEVTYPNRPADS